MRPDTHQKSKYAEEVILTEFRVNDVELQDFLYSFTDGDGKLPSDFEQLKREGHYLIHGDAERSFCLKEREVYLKDTMENLLAKSICFFSNMPVSCTLASSGVFGEARKASGWRQKRAFWRSGYEN